MSTWFVLEAQWRIQPTSTGTVKHEVSDLTFQRRKEKDKEAENKKKKQNTAPKQIRTLSGHPNPREKNANLEI